MQQPFPRGNAGCPGLLPPPLSVRVKAWQAQVEWVFRNSAAEPRGNNCLRALISLQLDLALHKAYILLLLDQYLGGEEQMCTPRTQRRPLLFKTVELRAEEPGQPPSPSPFPLLAEGTVDGSAAVCHLLLQTSVLAAFHAEELSVLPSPPPSSCSSSPLPEMAIQMGVQTVGRCSGCFPTYPGMGQPTPPHQDLGSWICKPLMAHRCALL